MAWRLGYWISAWERNVALGTMLWLLIGASSASAQSLTIATEEMPPFNMSVRGKVEGLASEILIAALAETQISYKISVYPWLRAYEMALKEPETCVYSTTRTNERDLLFKWVGPLAMDHWTVFAMADN